MEVLRSEAFIKALLGVVSTVIVAFIPQAQPYLEIIIPALVVLFGMWFSEPAIQGYAANQRAQAALAETQAAYTKRNG